MKVDGDGGVGNKVPEEECPICLMEPEPNNRYRLQICGHVICASCLQLQFQFDSLELPFVCSQKVMFSRTSNFLIHTLIISFILGLRHSIDYGGY